MDEVAVAALVDEEETPAATTGRVAEVEVTAHLRGATVEEVPSTEAVEVTVVEEEVAGGRWLLQPAYSAH